MTNALRTYDVDALEAIMARYDQPTFRARQLYEWLHAHHAASYDEMTNLPLTLRKALNEAYPFSTPRIADRQISADGSRKYVLTLNDGAQVETIGIPKTSGTTTRLTVCLSTQVGCSMGCLFCATGQEGFSRNLTSEEIVDQIIAVERDFAQQTASPQTIQTDPQRITNVVVMGQGEPFLNYDELLRALRIMNSPEDFNIGARHITTSTCGIIDGIQRFSHEPEQFTLALSLHSAIQQKRDRLMPRMANRTLAELKNALLDYVENTNRRVTLEYLLIKDFNDRPEDVAALGDFCRGLLCNVNLLTMNTIEGVAFEPSSPNTTRYWENELQKRGIETTMRRSRGADISGACGQLKNTTA